MHNHSSENDKFRYILPSVLILFCWVINALVVNVFHVQVNGLYTPFIKFFSSSTSIKVKVLDLFVNKFKNTEDIKKEISESKAKIHSLQGRINSSVVIEQKFLALKKLLNFQDAHFKVVASASSLSTARGMLSSGYCIIDANSTSGVKVGDVVVYNDGVILGVITAVNNKFSHVRTTMHSVLNIPVYIGKNSIHGLVKGGGKNKQVYISEDVHVNKMDGALREGIIKPGDAVVTSGFANIFPHNMLVGHIDDSGNVLVNDDLINMRYVLVLRRDDNRT